MSSKGKTKKILLLRSNIGFYGAERVVLELAKGLKARGHQPIVGVIHNLRNPHYDFESAAQNAQLPIKVFDSRRPWDWRTIKAIRAFALQEKIDVVHSHGYKADVYAWLAGRGGGWPLVSTCHPWLETDSNRKAKIYAKLDKLVLSRFSHVVAISEGVRKEYLASRSAKRHIDVIANGIDLDTFEVSANHPELRQELSIANGARIVGAVGRLSPEKGYDVLLQAFARLGAEEKDPVVLMLVGDGPEKENLLRLGEKLNIADRLRFLGARTDVPALLKLMDVFVLSSFTEGVPMALLEAMAAHRPIVATEVGEVSQILGRDAGLLIKPNDVRGLADSIGRLLRDRQMSQKCAEHARQRVAQNYSSDMMVVKYVNIYERLLNNSMKAQ